MSGSSRINGVEIPEPIKVEEVRTQFLVKGDEFLAEKMQKLEFSDKYQNNKFNRRTVRADIPVARSIQIEEEENLREQQLFQEQHNREMDSKDSILAQQILQQDYISEVLQRNRLESNDYEVARRMQSEEKEKYKLRKKSQLLKKERNRLENEQLNLLCNSESAGSNAMKENPRDRVLRQDGKKEDSGDFNDFYIQPSNNMNENSRKELQELQDQELSRLLQDQEYKRSSKQKSSDVVLMEDTDAALAAVIQKQEKLKADKYLARKELKKKLAQRTTSLPAYPEPPAYNNHQSPSPTQNNVATVIERQRVMPDTPDRLLPDPSYTVDEHRQQERDHNRNRMSEMRRVTDNPYTEPEISSTREDAIRESTNVITSIDPTFKARQSRISDRYPENNYSNMADMSSADEIVRGQRRSSKNKDTNKANCKQQ